MGEHLPLGVCAALSRRPAEAAQPAGRAGERAAAVGAQSVVEAAGQLLNGMTDVPDAALLTARDEQIPLLVATGATNRKIAAALSVAPKTVAAHVEHILGKLGAARRAQIASWVAGRPAARLQSSHRND